MELHTKALHEAEIQDRLQALEYEAHALNLAVDLQLASLA